MPEPRILLVTAHPLQDSLCFRLAGCAQKALAEKFGVEPQRFDLNQMGFDPVLSASERSAYHNETYKSASDEDQAEALRQTDYLVLVFPTWWFGPPAILKGWFDRIWSPGTAFDHADEFGPIKPKLDRLQGVLVITTLGSPWWVDRLLLFEPLKRTLRLAIIKTCAAKAKFRMLSLYKAEDPGEARIASFEKKIVAAVARLDR